jgi:hypothetical protein
VVLCAGIATLPPWQLGILAFLLPAMQACRLVQPYGLAMRGMCLGAGLLVRVRSAVRAHGCRDHEPPRRVHTTSSRRDRRAGGDRSSGEGVLRRCAGSGVALRAGLVE